MFNQVNMFLCFSISFFMSLLSPVPNVCNVMGESGVEDVTLNDFSISFF